MLHSRHGEHSPTRRRGEGGDAALEHARNRGRGGNIRELRNKFEEVVSHTPTRLKNTRFKKNAAFSAVLEDSDACKLIHP